MTTNREWLYSLDVADLAAWFDAEHVETEERALDGDTAALEAKYGKGGVIGNSLCDTPEQGEVVMPLESWREYLETGSENEDSRDKLEADVRKIAEAYNMDTQRHGTERFAHELYYSIIHLLERQAAITEEQTRCKWVTASAEKIAAWRSKAEKRKEQVYELTAERDEWKSCWEKCKAQSDAILAERDNLKANNEQLHTLAGEQAAQIDELQKQVDELEAKCEHQRRELAMFNNLVNTHGLAITDDCWDYRSVRELCDENDELQTRLFRVEADCERYRSKFGKCIDYADAIHALMDDEGMA